MDIWIYGYMNNESSDLIGVQTQFDSILSTTKCVCLYIAQLCVCISGIIVFAALITILLIVFVT